MSDDETLPAAWRRSPSRGGGAALLILLSLGAPEAAMAAEPAAEKVSRLGFRFDARAHDEAAASAKAKADGVADEPPPGVVRLPRYVVKEDLLRLRPDELLTPEGRVMTARKRYLNPAYQKTLGPIAAAVALINNPLGGWNPNTPEAMALYEDDEQKRRNTEMRDLVQLQTLSAELTAAEAKRPAKKE